MSDTSEDVSDDDSSGHWSDDFLLYFALALVLAVLFVIFDLPETNAWLSDFVSSYESLILLKFVMIFLLIVLFDRIFLGIRYQIETENIKAGIQA